MKKEDNKFTFVLSEDGVKLVQKNGNEITLTLDVKDVKLFYKFTLFLRGEKVNVSTFDFIRFISILRRFESPLTKGLEDIMMEQSMKQVTKKIK